MTQKPSNNGNSSRLDRIEAILERTVTDREVDRQEINELRSALEQLTRRVNNLVERVTLLEDNRPSYGSSDFGEQQASIIETFSQIKEINDSLATSRSLFYQTQQGLDKTNISLQENNTSLDTLKAALEAAKERQERMLDYIRQKEEDENA